MFAASHGSPGHAGHAFNPVQHGLEVGGSNREDAPAQAGSAMHEGSAARRRAKKEESARHAQVLSRARGALTAYIFGFGLRIVKNAYTMLGGRMKGGTFLHTKEGLAAKINLVEDSLHLPPKTLGHGTGEGGETLPRPSPLLAHRSRIHTYRASFLLLYGASPFTNTAPFKLYTSAASCTPLFRRAPRGTCTPIVPTSPVARDAACPRIIRQGIDRLS